jgi:hypothetical protein
MGWPALYCPRQNRIVGPHSKFFADTLQQTFNLVLRDNRLHLVHASSAEPDADRRAQTLCGESAAGEITSFLRVYTRANPKIRPSLRLATFMANGAMVLFVGGAFYTLGR